MGVGRTIWLVPLLAVCGGEPPAGPAARVGEHPFSAERLAEVLVLAQPLALDAGTAADFAHHWLEVMLIGSRAAAGDSLLGPAVAAEAMAPELRELRIAIGIERDAGDALVRALEMTDSLYADGDVRLLAHVFLSVGPNARPGEKEVQRSTADQIRRALASGGAWSDAVARSEDPDTRERDGLIGLVRRGELVPDFEAAAFALRPGETSGVVETEYGFHIIRRPLLAEVRGTFAQLVAAGLRTSAEAEIGARLVTGARLAVAPDAAARTREMARDPWSALGRDDAYVRHDGGTLRGDEVARSLLLLAPAMRDAMVRGSDVDIEGFLRGLVLRNLLAARADSMGVVVPDSAARAVIGRYQDVIRTVWRAANISPDSLAIVPAGAERERLAAERVDRYIDAVAARRVALATVPPLLTVRLLRGADWNVDQQAVAAAVEAARRMVAAAETR